MGYLEVEGSGSCAEMDRDVALPEAMAVGGGRTTVGMVPPVRLPGL